MFTDNFLELLQPKKSKYDVREKTGSGFSVSVHPSGIISFIFFYHFNGRKRRMTLGRYPYLSLDEARIMHHESLIKLEHGIDPALRKQLRIIDTRKSLHVLQTR